MPKHSRTRAGRHKIGASRFSHAGIGGSKFATSRFPHHHQALGHTFSKSRHSRTGTRGFNFALISPTTAAKYDSCYKYRWWMIGGGMALIVVGFLLPLGIIKFFKTSYSPFGGDAATTSNSDSTTTRKTLSTKSSNFPLMAILFGFGFFVFIVSGCILCSCGLRVRAYKKYKEWQVMAQANGINPLAHPDAMDNVYVTPVQLQAMAPHQQQYPGTGYAGYPAAAPPKYDPQTHPGVVPGSYPEQVGCQPYSTGLNSGSDQGVAPQPHSNEAQFPGSIY